MTASLELELYDTKLDTKINLVIMTYFNEMISTVQSTLTLAVIYVFDTYDTHDTHYHSR
jgi:hypothetical protein